MPEELVTSRQGYSGKDSQGTESPKNTLFHGLMDEIIVGVVRL